MLFLECQDLLNDITVLNGSSLMNNIANGETTPVEFVANDHTYNYGYYFTDDIYPKWQTFVKPLKKPEGKINLDFHNVQAAVKNRRSTRCRRFFSTPRVGRRRCSRSTGHCHGHAYTQTIYFLLYVACSDPEGSSCLQSRPSTCFSFFITFIWLYL